MDLRMLQVAFDAKLFENGIASYVLNRSLNAVWFTGRCRKRYGL